MNINDTFPSKYLKASDLKGQTVSVKISHVQMEDLDGEQKAVVYFLGASKGVVLNKTNASSISLAYGDETDSWGGSAMDVFPSTTDFGGRVVDCIRMKAPPAQPAAAPPPAIASAPEGFNVAPGLPEQRGAEEDDLSDIPF